MAKQNIPKDSREASRQLDIRYSTSPLVGLMNALPYLVDYPYGCTEQTLNRFLPVVTVHNLLANKGIELPQFKMRENTNSLRKSSKKIEPVLGDKHVKKVLKRGLKRLYTHSE